MAYSTTPGMLTLSAGVLIGFGLAGASFTIVLAAFGKLLARGVALVCVRRRHRGRIVRPVPVLAARGRAARHGRLAQHADRLRRDGAALPAARLRGRDARAGHERCGECGAAAVVPRGARRSLRPRLLHPARARLLHLRLPRRVHHHASAAVSARQGARCEVGRLGDRVHRPVQHHRLDHRRDPRRQAAEALSALARSISCARSRSRRSCWCR